MNQWTRAFNTLAMVLLLGAASSAQATINWTTRYEVARAQAASEGKLILINIHASLCIPCKKLQAGTLSDPSLGAEIMQHCIAVSLDADQDDAVIRQWPITGFPTQLFLTPDGRVVNSIVGNVTVETYREALRKALENARGATPNVAQQQSAINGQNVVSKDIAPAMVRPPVTPPTPQGAFPPPPRPLMEGAPAVASNNPQPNFPPTPVAPGPPTSPAGNDFQMPAPGTLPPSAPAPAPAALAANTELAPTPSAPAPVVEQEATLALAGYCPVTMLNRAELVKGAPALTSVYKGKRYHFATESEKALFAENPKKYLPSEDGFCVVTWAEGHRRAAGSIDYPALFGDYLFLFANDDVRQKFLRDPERYVDNSGRAHRIPLHTFRGDRDNIR